MGRKVWGTLIAGAVLLIAAVAGFVISGDHMPEYGDVGCPSDLLAHCSWSNTAYDVVRIASWACGIVGLILVAVGLIRAWRTSQAGTPA
jgi:hypothetical protein